MADFQEPQTVNDEQHLQELRERINAKAENLVKWHNTQGRKKHWEFITVWIILIAILIAVEVYSYVKNDYCRSYPYPDYAALSHKNEKRK